ncbi:flagellar hook-length control protein FliK [mine drainage metagenome]|uniref:Flagellar hook-length control protein FliK n=1 Tax=mine drainage metagenome TaxID=410659 RepID=A0A1J5RM55_9ZZZZ
MSSLPGVPAALPATQAGGAAFDARPVAPPGSPAAALALPPGTRVLAEVVQTQADGQVLLRLGQALLAATLPGQHAVGQQLPLVVLSEPGAQPLLLLAPPNSPALEQTQLSATAQLLGRLQQLAPQGVAVQRAGPVWAEPGPMPAPQLAHALAQSVKSSGLFYESHLAAWAQGQLPLPELLAEPQGQLSPLLARLPTPASAAPPAGMPVAVAVAAPQAKAARQAAAPSVPGAPDQAPAQTSGVLPPAAQTAAGDPGLALRAQQALQAYAGLQARPAAMQAGITELPAQLQGLVQQQLATLAQGQVLWAGQIWPGQDLQWRIEPNDARAGGEPGSASARGWTTVLKLDLPQLGQLVVTLHLGADQHLRVKLQHSAQAASILQDRHAEFSRSLQDAGLQLDALALQPLPTP